MAADNDLKLETKCYDACEYGYLYGLNKKIPDEEWEKVKPYMRKWKRMDFVEGNIKVTGRPEGYRCLEEDVAKVEEILGITNTLAKRKANIEEKMADPIKKVQFKDQCYNWLTMLFKSVHSQSRTCQDLLSIPPKSMILQMDSRMVLKMDTVSYSFTPLMECGI